MIEMWQKWVSPSDTILHLGDLNTGKREWFQEVAQQLPGKKYLIKGNHDKQSIQWYADHGFEVIEPFSVSYEDYTIHFSHYPARNLMPRHISCHGHIHGNYVDCLTTSHIGFSVEIRYFRPMPVQSLIDNTIKRLEHFNSSKKDCK
jgi:calcineurin-like phosphoesterase family protein